MERRATTRATACADPPEGHESQANVAECGLRSRRRSGPSLSPYSSAAPITGLLPTWLNSGSVKGDDPSLVCGSYVCSPCSPSGGRPRRQNQHSRGGPPSGLSGRRLLVGAFSTNKCFLIPSQRKLEHSVSTGPGPWAPPRPPPRLPRRPTLPRGANARGGKWELIQVKTFLCFKGCQQECGKTTTDWEKQRADRASAQGPASVQVNKTSVMTKGEGRG